MTVSLFDISVRGYRQTVDAAVHFLKLGLSHAEAAGLDPIELVEARLFHDMLPFRFQVHSIVHHSTGALEALRTGHFAPPRDLPEHDYPGLIAHVAAAQAALAAVTEAEIDQAAGRRIVFSARGMERHFTAEGFILSFSLPNLHFHAATAYDILRMKGVPVGKRDFIGQLWLSDPA